MVKDCYVAKTKNDVSRARMYKVCVLLIEVTTSDAVAEDRS